jgi:hypothetical protein
MTRVRFNYETGLHSFLDNILFTSYKQREDENCPLGKFSPAINFQPGIDGGEACTEILT